MEGLIPFQQCSRVAKQYGPPRFDLNRLQYPLSQTYVLKMQCTSPYVCTGPHLCEYVSRVLGDFNVQIIETLKCTNPYLHLFAVKSCEDEWTQSNQGYPKMEAREWAIPTTHVKSWYPVFEGCTAAPMWAAARSTWYHPVCDVHVLYIPWMFSTTTSVGVPASSVFGGHGYSFLRWPVTTRPLAGCIRPT